MEHLGTTLTCAFSRWSLELGDHHVAGWMIVLVYLAAALCSARAAAGLGPEGQAGRERRFWWIASALLLLLAVNKQLDLQSLLTVVARCHASLAGWYDDRRAVQRVFVWTVAAGGVAMLALLALLLRGFLRQVWPALLGLGFVCVFVVIRAASFHRMDGLIGRTALGLEVNWLLELVGPILVLVSAMHRRRVVVGP